MLVNFFQKSKITNGNYLSCRSRHQSWRLWSELLVFDGLIEPSEVESVPKEKQKKEPDKKELDAKYEQAEDALLGADKGKLTENMGQLLTDRLEKIKTERKEKEALRENLAKATPNQRSKVEWWDQKGSTKTARDLFGSASDDDEIRHKIHESFEKNASIQDILKKFGLDDQNGVNRKVMEAVIFEVTSNYINSLNTTAKDEIERGAEAEIQTKMLVKVEKVFNAVIAMAEEKDAQGKPKYGFDSAAKALAAFCEFIGFKFYQNGFLQDGDHQLRDFLLQDEATCATFIQKFQEYSNLGVDLQNLDAEAVDRSAALAKISQQDVDIATMLKEGTLKIPRTDIALPADADEAKINEAFEQGIRQALQKGQKLNFTTQNLAVEHFMKEKDALNPKPKAGETLTFENGVFTPHTAAEIKQQKEVEAKNQAEAAKNAQAAATAAAQKPPEKSAGTTAAVAGMEGLAALPGVGNIIEKLTALIQKFTEWLNKTLENFNLNDFINKIFGGSKTEGASFDFATKVKDWPKYGGEDQKILQNFYQNALQTHRIKSDYLAKLFEDPVSTKKVLRAKPDVLSWSSFLNQNLNVKTGKLNGTENLMSAQIAEFLTAKGEQKPEKAEPKNDSGPPNDSPKKDEAVS